MSITEQASRDAIRRLATGNNLQTGLPILEVASLYVALVTQAWRLEAAEDTLIDDGLWQPSQPALCVPAEDTMGTVGDLVEEASVVEAPPKRKGSGITCPFGTPPEAAETKPCHQTVVNTPSGKGW